MNLGKKVGINYILVVLVTLIGLMFVRDNVRDSVKSLSLNESQNILESIETDLKDLIYDAETNIELLGQLLIDGDLDQLENNANLMLRRNDLYKSVVYGFKDGSHLILPRTDLGSYDPRERPWYKSAINKHKLVISEPYFGRVAQTNVIAVSKEIIDEKGIRYGVLGLNIDLGALSDRLNSYRIGEEGYAILFHKGNKKVISHPSSDMIGRSYEKLDDEFVFFNGNIEPTGTLDYTYQGDDKFLYYTYIKKFDWILTGGTNYSEFEDRYRKIDNTIYILSVLGLIIMGFAWFYIQKHIIQNIKNLSNKFTDLASGKLDVSLRVSKRKDELQEMQIAFNNFTSEFALLIKDIEVRLKKAVEENNGIIEELALSVNGGEESGMVQLKGYIAETMDNVRNQTASTEESLAGVEEVAASADSMLQNVEEALKVSQDSIEKAEDSLLNIKNMSDKITEVSKNVEDADMQVGELVKISENIGGISLAITALAEQTNLLALNAAIESARAGEAGRGFAVVAQEIKKLAERTNEETEKIDNLILAIHSEIGKVRDANNVVKDNVKDSLEIRDAVNKNIKEIVMVISEGDDRINEVAVTVREQQIATEEISKAISNISDMSTEIESKETDNFDISERVTGLMLEKLDKIREISDELEEVEKSFEKFTY